MSDQGPTVFNGRYELLRHIARGGMADVYLARDELLDREVALKVLFPEFANDPNFVERFRREAQAAANLNHPNIVGIYDWGQERGTYYIVMEHVSGRSMSDVLRSTGPLQPDRAAEIAIDVAAALSTAHQAGLVHRDIKPGNILVSDGGDVKVADFGIATALAGGSDAGLTQHGSVMGTATYFSPEQAQGKPVDGRSDLYALGVVLYELLAGAPPFQAETPVAVAYQHVQERPESLEDRGITVPSSLNAITMKLLAKNPANRYPTADDLRSDLRRYLAGAHKVPGGAAAAAGAAGAAGVAGAAAAGAVIAGGAAAAGVAGAASDTAAVTPTPAAEPSLAVDPTLAQPITPASATQPAGLDPAAAAAAALYADSAYYDDDGPAEDDWKRTVALLFGLSVLIFVLGFLTIAFARTLGLFGDDSGSDAQEEVDGEKIEVPNLDGLQVQEAEAELRSLGLVPVRRPQQNENRPVDEVFDQSPPAGQKLDEGDEVEIFVSTGEATTVPSVISMTQEEATAALAAEGYTVQVEERADTQDVGLVVGQTPVPGTAHPLEEPVVIVVSTGPDQVVVPDLAGKSLVEAIRLLDEAGLTVEGEPVPQASETITEGRVIGTEPAKDSLVDVGTSVTIKVSSGVPLIATPRVVGLFYDTAEAALRNSGLVPVAEFQTVPFEDPQVGLVISQNPAEFEEVPVGSEVVIIVGEAGPASTSSTTTTTTTTEAVPEEPPEEEAEE